MRFASDCRGGGDGDGDGDGGGGGGALWVTNLTQVSKIERVKVSSGSGHKINRKHLSVGISWKKAELKEGKNFLTRKSPVLLAIVKWIGQIE